MGGTGKKGKGLKAGGECEGRYEKGNGERGAEKREYDGKYENEKRGRENQRNGNGRGRGGWGGRRVKKKNEKSACIKHIWNTQPGIEGRDSRGAGKINTRQYMKREPPHVFIFPCPFLCYSEVRAITGRGYRFLMPTACVCLSVRPSVGGGGGSKRHVEAGCGDGTC